MTAVDLFFSLTILLLLITFVLYVGGLVRSWRTGEVLTVEVDREIIELLDTKSHLLEDLRDLELDFKMGKIAEDEYVRRKRVVEPQAVKVIRELERRGLGSTVSVDDDEIDDESGGQDA